ncbi:hypothetical protein COV19_07325 [Candidatus Woesearchaeota archaeon CG10_big_fil_rev_8_21_14_0_10_44_13]|nr:MAG: hypothetical protein COV19_07325 [Candidatus Woesearchaeota archaeon CG10_big_fil_rev_8_21_14_0_10_44_13]
MLIDYLKLAVNNLLKRRMRSWLTLIGIFIGIAAVVSLIGLGEGLRIAISSQFNMLGTDTITIQASGVQYGPPGTGVVTPLKQDYVDKIANVDGVDFAIGRLLKTSKVEFNDRATFTVAGSMPSGQHRGDIEERINLKADQGRLLRDGDKYKVLMGSKYDEDDKVFGKLVKVGDTVLIQGKAFEVVGIAKNLGNFLMDYAVIVNEDDMRDIFNDKDTTSIIMVMVKKGADMNNVKEDIEKLLRKERDVKEGEEDFTVELSINAIKTLESTLFAVQLFVYIIAGISIVVGGIGIMNTMYTAVVERTKEIGILKSIGARNEDIFLLFFIESGLLGFSGGLAGAIIGVILAKTLAFIGAMQLGTDLIHADIAWWLITGALSFSFLIGCVAGITPAWRASRLHPVDALRYAK